MLHQFQLLSQVSLLVYCVYQLLIFDAGPSKQQVQLRPSTVLFLSTEATAPQDYDPPFILLQREETTEQLAAETIEVPQFRILEESELLTRVRTTKGEVRLAGSAFGLF